jgi:hypothetical protein
MGAWLVRRWPICWVLALRRAAGQVREAEDRTRKATEAAQAAAERAGRVAAVRRQRDVLGRRPAP